MNKVELLGRTTKDVELKQTKNGEDVAYLTIAVDKKVRNADGVYEKQTDFIPITVFGKSAQSVAKFCGAGSLVFIPTAKINVFEQPKNDDGTYNAPQLRISTSYIEFLVRKEPKQSGIPSDNNTTSGSGIDGYIPTDENGNVLW